MSVAASFLVALSAAWQAVDMLETAGSFREQLKRRGFARKVAREARELLGRDESLEVRAARHLLSNEAFVAFAADPGDPTLRKALDDGQVLNLVPPGADVELALSRLAEAWVAAALGSGSPMQQLIDARVRTVDETSLYILNTALDLHSKLDDAVRTVAEIQTSVTRLEGFAERHAVLDGLSAELPDQLTTASGGTLPRADGDEINLFVQSGRPPRAPATMPYRTHGVPAVADCYQAREATTRLAAIAAEGETAVLSQVLSGLGGVGKTQLAAAYAKEVWQRQDVDILVWITASSEDSVLSGYADVLYELTGIDDEDRRRAARRFLAWLADTDHRWLVVLDGVTRPGDLTGLWPPSGARGTTIITTRRKDSALVSRGQLVEVGVFTPEEARAYLTAKLAARPDLADELDELAQDLGFLPLALAQAAHYLLDRDLTVSEYRTRLANTRTPLDALVPEADALPDDHRRTLAATWAISVEHADQLKPAGLSTPLLTLASLLDGNGIPETVFTTNAARSFVTDHRTVHRGDVTAADTRDGLRCLQRLSLVEVLKDRGEVRVHPLVQRATRDMQPDAGSHDTVVRSAADALLQAWPDVDRDRNLARLLRANASSLAALQPDVLWDRELGGHEVLFRAGDSLGKTGLVADAVAYFDDLCQTSTSKLGADHPSTLAARSSLASWRGRSGDVVGAAVDFEQLLADRTRILGPHHPDTLATRASVAAYRGRLGDPGGAVTAYEALLADQLRVSAVERDVVITRSRLAAWRGYAGDPAAAAAEFEAVLDDMVHVLGADDPHTLITRASLAAWRGKAGDPTAAVAGFETLLTDRDRVLGPDHPATLTTRGSLAMWRARAGDPATAVAEFEQLLDDAQRVLSPGHPSILATRASLASCRGHAGDPAAAVTGFELLLEDRLGLQGSHHPQTLVTRASLANWRGQAGDPVAAVEDLDGLVGDMRQVYAPDHPDLLGTRSALIRWRVAAGDMSAALNEAERLLADEVDLLGADHPWTLATRTTHVFRIGSKLKSPSALAALERLLAVHLTTLGPDSPETLTTQAQVAICAGRRDQAVAALDQLRQALVGWLEALGPDDRDVVDARERVMSWLRISGDVAAAIGICSRLLHDEQHLLGVGHPHTARTLSEVAKYYRQTSDEVGESYALQQLLEIRTRTIGRDHPVTLSTRARVANWRGRAGDVRGAADDMRELLADRVRVLGRKHRHTLDTRLDAARWRRKAGEHSRALKELETLMAEQTMHLGVDHPETVKTGFRLARWRANPPVVPPRVNTSTVSSQAVSDPKRFSAADDGPARSPAAELEDLVGEKGSRWSDLTLALLEALALAGGHGVPRAHGVWAAMASALTDGVTISDADVGEMLQRATAHVEVDIEGDETVYRLANHRLGAIIIDRMATAMGIGAAYAVALRQKRIARALFALSPENPYVIKYLAWHVGAADCWSELRRRVRVLNRLDPDSVTEEVLRHLFGLGPIPSDIASIARLRPLLAGVPPEDRIVIRGMATKRHISSRANEHETRRGSWAFKWAKLAPATLNVALRERPPERQHHDESPAAVQAVATLTVRNETAVFATGDHSGAIKLWNPSTGDMTGEIEAGGPVAALTPFMAADGRTLLVAAAVGRSVQLFDPLTCQETDKPLLAKVGNICALTTVPWRDGRTLLVAAGGTTRLWDPLTHEPIGKPMVGHTGRVNDLSAFRHGKRWRLATAGEDGTVRLWNLNAQKLERSIVAAHAGAIYAVTTLRRRDPNARQHQGDSSLMLATGGDDGTVRLWSLINLHQVGDTMTGLPQSPVRAIAAFRLPDGRNMIAAGGDANVVTLWDARTSYMQGLALQGHTAPITDIAALSVPAANGTKRMVLASCSQDGSVRLWAPENHQRPRPPQARPDTAVAALAIVETGGDGQVAVVTGHADGTVRQQDVTDGSEIAAPIEAHGGKVRAMAATRQPGGKTQLVTFGDDLTLAFHDTSGQRIARSQHDSETRVRHVLPVPTGEDRVLAATVTVRGAVTIYDPTTGESVRSFDTGHGRVASATIIQPSDHRPTWLAIAGPDQTIEFWDPINGQPARPPLTANSKPLHAMVGITLPDGRTLLAVGANRSVTLWDPVTATVEAALTINSSRSQTSHLVTVRADDGRRLLVSIDRRSTIRLWDPSTQDMLHKLRVEGPIIGCHAAGPWLAIGTGRGVAVIKLDRPPLSNHGDNERASAPAPIGLHHESTRAVLVSIDWDGFEPQPDSRLAEWLGVTDPVVCSWIRASQFTGAAAAEAGPAAPRCLRPAFIRQLAELGQASAAALAARDQYVDGEREPSSITNAIRAGGPTLEEQVTSAAPILDDAVLGAGLSAEIAASEETLRRVKARLSFQFVGACAVTRQLDQLRSRIGMPAPPMDGPRESLDTIPRNLVRHARDVMRLPADAEHLVAESLIHPSWAYENMTQGDRPPTTFTALAVVGAWSLRYWALRQRMIEGVTAGRPPRTTTAIDLSVPAITELARRLDVTPLVGAGFRGTGPSDEMLADCAQALVGAIAVSAGLDTDLDNSTPLFRWITERVQPED